MTENWTWKLQQPQSLWPELETNLRSKKHLLKLWTDSSYPRGKVSQLQLLKTPSLITAAAAVKLSRALWRHRPRQPPWAQLKINSRQRPAARWRYSQKRRSRHAPRKTLFRLLLHSTGLQRFQSRNCVTIDDTACYLEQWTMNVVCGNCLELHFYFNKVIFKTKTVTF